METFGTLRKVFGWQHSWQWHWHWRKMSRVLAEPWSFWWSAQLMTFFSVRLWLFLELRAGSVPGWSRDNANNFERDVLVVVRWKVFQNSQPIHWIKFFSNVVAVFFLHYWKRMNQNTFFLILEWLFILKPLKILFAISSDLLLTIYRT